MYQVYYYSIIFFLSFFMTLLYVFQWQKQYQVHMTVTFVLIPIANLGYLLMYTSFDQDTVLAMLKICYSGGCFLPWLLTMCQMRLCHIHVKRSIRIATLMASTCIFLSVLTAGYLPLFYKTLTLDQVGAVWVTRKAYGPFHTLHYCLLGMYLLWDMAALLYSYRKRKQVSRKILFLLFIPVPVAILLYYVNRYLLRTGFELVPLVYLMAQVLYLLIIRRMAYYSVSEMVVESMVQSGSTGFITVDMEGKYLGSNETAKRILPELSCLTVDKPIPGEGALKDTVADWLERFRRDPGDRKFLYTWEGTQTEGQRIYTAEVNHLFDGRLHCGYQILLQDDTKNQEYIRLLDQYNTDLQEDVEEKTRSLEAMHDRLILSMAAMVESRDNSTGGHIRRTSQGVRILMEVMKEEKAPEINESFIRNIIKAAPMHDLGKIAVDDAILRKPGRFTPEEFEKMKAHAAEGARIVEEILRDTEDKEFCRIAVNVAHYHHERMDGSGYPDGLKGRQIPLEARIMAIADVYDALVSKRVYKDAFSFEKANAIILEGMGPQFDPALEKYYRKALPRLESYYSVTA